MEKLHLTVEELVAGVGELGMPMLVESTRGKEYKHSAAAQVQLASEQASVCTGEDGTFPAATTAGCDLFSLVLCLQDATVQFM
jgi:hypothetical protein